jgi:predicted transcriptional regulator
MNLQSILKELRSQRTRIEQAIDALQGTSRGGRTSRVSGMKRRPMSAAARARIGLAKKAW